MLPAIFDHLWQSTLFVVTAGLLTFALRKNRARVRQGVWLAAACKFLIPVSLLITLGSQFSWRTEPVTNNVAIVMDQVSQPFTTQVFAVSAVQPVTNPLPAILFGIWLCGFIGISFSWLVRWRRIRATVRAGSPANLELPIRAVYSHALMEPGVFGIFRPVLLLPEGIADRLTPEQLKAVIAHELCHVHHRDNLTATIQMFVETIFWFHPLVWWLGKQMIAEREQACDEEVLRFGTDPRAYAQGILNICRHYTGSPLVCVSGVTGSNLKKRVQMILEKRIANDLSRTKKAFLAVAGMTTLMAPLVIGMIHAPVIQAQTPATISAHFDVASIKPSALWKSGAEGSKRTRVEYTAKTLSMWNTDLTDCVEWAYDAKFFQVSGPDFPNSERYDILAKSDKPVSVAQLRAMLRDLLDKRFQLTLHREVKMLPAYNLVIAKGGPKLPAPKTEAEISRTHAAESLPRVQDGNFIFHETTISEFAAEISMLRGVDAPVIDKTGIKGVFDIALVKSAASAILEADGNSPLFSFIQDQLGLKLVSVRAPIEMFVIDHVAAPSEN